MGSCLYHVFEFPASRGSFPGVLTLPAGNITVAFELRFRFLLERQQFVPG